MYLFVATRSVNKSSLRYFSGINELFAKSEKALKELLVEPDQDTKLKLYALYKQSKDGPINIPQPGIFDMVGKAKYTAWKSLGSLSKEKVLVI